MLSEDQAVALEKIGSWYKGNEPYFILKGFAGTGKTFLMSKIREIVAENLFYTATTNKAAKVLSGLLNEDAKTVYSLLALRMIEAEDQLILERSGRAPYLPQGSVIVVDEASMVPTKLMEVIDETVLTSGIRVIYVGDPAQLPPVNERYSSVWALGKDDACKAFLKKVMRNDNQLLALATEVRASMLNKDYASPIRHNLAEDGTGVYKHSSQEKFEKHLVARAKDINWRAVKVVAWRNAQVAYYNSVIRYELGYTDPYCEGEILLLSKPVERDDEIVAHTDDEFEIDRVTEGSVRVDLDLIKTWCLEVSSGEQTLILNIPKVQKHLDSLLSDKANTARSKSNPKAKTMAWKDFWNTKKKFDEVRYGYALTAHKSQGSTLEECYVDQQDILGNFRDIEAFQCLYVAVTRPTKTLHTF